MNARSNSNGLRRGHQSILRLLGIPSPCNCRRGGEASMNAPWILKATLRTAAWKSMPAPPSIPIRTVLFWMIAAMTAEAARQYFAIEDTAIFSLYGINSIIAEMAMAAAIGLLFFSRSQTAALAQLFALVVLAECVAIAANRWPVIAATTIFVAAGLVYLSRHRSA